MFKNAMKTLGHILRNLLLIVLVLFILAFLVAGFLFYRGTTNYSVRYGAEITAAAEKEGLSPFLVAGVVKSESNFKADVVADDGGVGLMQLMPEAVDWVSDRLNLDKTTLNIKDPKTNLMIGTHYLAYLLSRYQSEHLAIVAYNTGLSNVDKWLKDGTITWDSDTMDNIPAEIPRRYVRRVEQAHSVYATMYKDGLPSDSSNENPFLLTLKNMKRTITGIWQRY